MRASRWLVAMGAMLAVMSGQGTIAQTASSTTHSNSQQEKMKTCNADANTKGLKGADRETYMKTCLSKGGSATKSNSQQEKMKKCNADANVKALKGDERKAYMQSCLSSSG